MLGLVAGAARRQGLEVGLEQGTPAAGGRAPRPRGSPGTASRPENLGPRIHALRVRFSGFRLLFPAQRREQEKPTPE